MNNQHYDGFTLIELIVTLAIISIPLLIAIPSGQYLIAENRTVAQVNSLVSAIHYARQEAIMRGEMITFCKSSDHKSCTGNWRDGQIAQNTTGNVLRVWQALPTGDRLLWNSSGGRDDSLQLLPSGYTNGQRGSFYYCSGQNDAAYSRAIVVWNTGRLYVTPVSAQDYAKYCVPEIDPAH